MFGFLDMLIAAVVGNATNGNYWAGGNFWAGQ